MTHDELLAKMGSTTCCSGVHELALRAVVELHKPEFHKAFSSELDWYECSHCNYSCWGCEEWADCGDTCGCKCHNIPRNYPCPTIQAIEKELG